jgi:hypothetical protein
MKKFLVNIYDRTTKKRLNQLVVNSESMEIALKRAIDFQERISSRKSKKRR